MAVNEIAFLPFLCVTCKAAAVSLYHRIWPCTGGRHCPKLTHCHSSLDLLGKLERTEEGGVLVSLPDFHYLGCQTKCLNSSPFEKGLS